MPPRGIPEPGPQFCRVPRITERLHFCQRQAARRFAARIERIDLVLFGDVDDGEEIAAWPDIHRLDDAQDGGRRDRGIDRVTALSQDVEAGFCGEWLAGGHHAVSREDLRAMLRNPALRAVARNAFAPRRRRCRGARGHRRLRGEQSRADTEGSAQQKTAEPEHRTIISQATHYGPLCFCQRSAHCHFIRMSVRFQADRRSPAKAGRYALAKSA